MISFQNIHGIYDIASSFRDAIQSAVQAGELREMASFPHGCCTYASDLLQRYLLEQGIVTWYLSGQYDYGWKAESHAWLETEDGMVIDITGDQYRYKNLKFTDPVYVGVRNDGFHDKFILDEPVAYSVSDDQFGQNTEFNRRYEAVLRHIKL